MDDPAKAKSKAGVLQWGLIKIILTLILLTAAFGTSSILLPPFLDGLGYHISAIGVLVSVLNIAALLSRLPSGLFYNASRAARLIRISLILFGVTTALYPFAKDPLFLWPLRFVNGLFYGVATTVNFAMYMDAIPPQVARHRALALYAGGLAAGHMVGNTIGGYTHDIFGMDNAFFITAFFSSAALLFTFRIQLHPQPPAKRPMGHRETKEDTQAAKTAGLSWLSRIRRFVPVFLDPLVVDMFMVAFFLNLFFSLAGTYLTLYALAVGLTLGHVGVIKGALSLTNAVTRPFSGDLASRFGEDRISNIGLTVTTCLLMVIPFLSTLAPLVVLFVLMGFMRAGVLVSNTVKAARVGEKSMSRGMASGLYNAATDLGTIVGPIYGGLIASQVGLVPMFWISPVVGLGAYFLVQLIARRRTGVFPGS